jgi:glyoxylase-like metal-dependent hydrolase (beta-lactamase superfamily II)
MNLEDHVGDVLRKARMMNHALSATVATAAGLSEAELAALEDSGQISKRPDFPQLAEALQLSASKLERLAQGWLPSAKDLSRWRELRMFTTTDGGMAVNCFLVWDEATREAALFDTGWNARVILETVADEKLALRHIFITHSHHDHVAALGDLRAAQPKVRVHSSSKNAPLDQRNKPNECVQLGGLRITHRDTPGHAEDGVTYIVGNWPEDAPHVAFVGDAIFAGSMGGAPQHGALAKQAVREQILSLPEDTLLGPGHGPLTTVREEKMHNPFF